MPEVDLRNIHVQIAVTVAVDPHDLTLLDIIQRSGGSLSIRDVVRAEVESNLESVSYVRHVLPASP